MKVRLTVIVAALVAAFFVGSRTSKAIAASIQQRERAADVAVAEVGVPYVWGGESPRGFDCSGLVRWAFRMVGQWLPRTTWAQMRVGRYIPRRLLRRGDVVFFNGGAHEALYLGGGLVVVAPRTGDVVRIVPLTAAGSYYTARRF